jgi:hypothetical protein
MERRADADHNVNGQSIRGVKPAGCRLQIERCEIGPPPVKLECARDVERIADALTAKYGSSAGQLCYQESFRGAAGIKS